MEVNNIFAYDLDYQDIDNQRAAQLKIQQVLVEERHASHFEDELVWRNSVVDIKGFLQEEKEKMYKSSEDEDIDASAIAEEVKGIDNRKWRLSYCEILEEKFLSSFPFGPDTPKELVDEIVKRGELIEEKVENVHYLLKKK